MDDRFAPLTENELARGSGCGGAPPHSGWKAIVPIPDGVRLPDLLVKKCCPSGYSIRSAWRYRTPAGGVSGFVVRYDEAGTDRKEFKPFTYCESAAGKREWRCRGMPEPRPLFNLDLLAAKPDAPVLVSEGEKSAARAARIFPESVCLTSAGGCKAWKQADWSPLAGRKVLIWPDCDEPGEEYSREVAHIIHGLGCSVSIIDAVALASMAPGGGQRQPGTGWDAADAVAEWRDMAALRKAAHRLARPYEPGPQFVSWGSFKMDLGGLTTEVAKGRGENATTETIWIASAFEVIGAGRDPQGFGWGKWLRWKDRDGRIHTRHVSDATLQGDPSVLCGGLADEGLSINRNQQRSFLTYLSGCNVKGRVTIVHRTGWHDIGGHQVFVLPAETMGPKGSLRPLARMRRAERSKTGRTA